MSLAFQISLPTVTRMRRIVATPAIGHKNIPSTSTSTKYRSKRIENYTTTIFIYEYYWHAQHREVETEQAVLMVEKKKCEKC
jgi:hypothetical protein